MRPLHAPVPFVDGNDLPVDDEADGIDGADDRELLVRMFAGNRIIVTVESNQGQRIGRVNFRTPCLEVGVRKRQERRFLFGKQFADRLRLFLARLDEFVPTLLFQRVVECLKVRKFRHRNHEVATQIVDGVFNMSFLLRLAHPTKMVREQVGRFELEQTVRRLLAATADDLADVHF